MNLAYTMAPGRGDTDLILFNLSRAMASRGFRCCGTVQINSERSDAGPCDMDVQVLPKGPILRISQDLAVHRAVAGLTRRLWRRPLALYQPAWCKVQTC